jgi:hypothetical protein
MGASHVEAARAADVTTIGSFRSGAAVRGANGGGSVRAASPYCQNAAKAQQSTPVRGSSGNPGDDETLRTRFERLRDSWIRIANAAEIASTVRK